MFLVCLASVDNGRGSGLEPGDGKGSPKGHHQPHDLTDEAPGAAEKLGTQENGSLTSLDTFFVSQRNLKCPELTKVSTLS